ncbi:MAG TPA: O-methyltransferase [Gemmatimonadales bacterium]|nr:O-methyltransferase [Gemmatimonadales bacterium]
MPDRWAAVDQYISDLLVQPDAVLTDAIAASDAAGLPSIAVSPSQGKMLMLLVRACRARRVLEVGTLGGYSTIWMARGLPADGHLTTLELNPTHAAVALANFQRAGLVELIRVRQGPAAESLRQLAREGVPPFDVVFIDADKTGYPEYLTLVMELVQPGSLIIADNVVRDGAVADPASTDPNVQAVRRYHEMLAADRRLSATVLQTVGSKGYDGLAFAMVMA